MTAKEGMKAPPEDLLLDLPIDVGAVEGGDRRFDRAGHDLVGGHLRFRFKHEASSLGAPSSWAVESSIA